MDAIRKQATKLREQVAKQQQAVLKQFGAGGYGGSDNVVTDEAELQQHQKLERLYISTRAGKHFQRDIVRGVEGFIVTGSKQVEIGSKLSEDSRKYGVENTCTSGSTLSKAALNYGRARGQMEKERGTLLKALGTQVAEPLRAMVMGAPLEDARHLAQRYDKMRQEAEAQAIEVSKRQMKVKESMGNPDVISKLEAAEAKLQELKSNMAVLGKEAAAAMAAVEAQQQRLTLQRLIAMVEAERTYHQRIVQILNQLEGEMVSERQRIEASPSPVVDSPTPPPPSYEEVNGVFASQTYDGSTDSMGYFLGEVIHSYQAESDVELNLSIGDVVVVRKIDHMMAKGASLQRTALHHIEMSHPPCLNQTNRRPWKAPRNTTVEDKRTHNARISDPFSPYPFQIANINLRFHPKSCMPSQRLSIVDTLLEKANQ